MNWRGEACMREGAVHAPEMRVHQRTDRRQRDLHALERSPSVDRTPRVRLPGLLQ